MCPNFSQKLSKVYRTIFLRIDINIITYSAFSCTAFHLRLYRPLIRSKSVLHSNYVFGAQMTF